MVGNGTTGSIDPVTLDGCTIHTILSGDTLMSYGQFGEALRIVVGNTEYP